MIFIFIIIFSQIVVRKGQEKYFHQEKKKKSIYKIESYSLRNLEPSFFDEFCCSDAV